MIMSLVCDLQVMVIRSATQQKPLRSNEAPLLHHARASAVVDVRKDVATHSSPQEIHLSVDQLLRDSRKLLYIAKRSQVLELLSMSVYGVLGRYS